MKLRFIDKFGEWLLNQRIVELASERNSSILDIKHMSDPINKHLFKIYVFQKSTYREHWKSEIYSFLEKVLKSYWGKNKRFEIDDYYKWLFIDYFFFNNQKSSKKIIYNNIINKYNCEIPLSGWSEFEFYNLCDSFYNKICVLLENGEFNDEKFEKIIEMFDIE